MRILDSDEGTAATTRVLIDFEKGTRSWTTVGASANIIEASWVALADALEYAIVREREGWGSAGETAAEQRAASS